MLFSMQMSIAFALICEPCSSKIKIFLIKFKHTRKSSSSIYPFGLFACTAFSGLWVEYALDRNDLPKIIKGSNF